MTVGWRSGRGGRAGYPGDAGLRPGMPGCLSGRPARTRLSVRVVWTGSYNRVVRNGSCGPGHMDRVV